MWNPYLQLSATKRNALGTGAVVFVLVAWSLVSGLDLVSSAALPSPYEVAVAFMRLVQSSGEDSLLNAVFWSVARVALAGVLVGVVGLFIGVLMGASPTIDALLFPLVDPFRSAPVAALLPILVRWLGIGEEMKVAFLFLGAVVFMVPMVRDAVRGVPQTYWISAYDLGAKPFEAVRKAVLPMAKPRIADAFIASVSIEWTYITVVEYVNAESGLGKIIEIARRIGAMDRIFATIFVIIGLALITQYTMTGIKKKLYPWAAEG